MQNQSKSLCLWSVIFEVHSSLFRLEKHIFSVSGLRGIVLPNWIEIICESSFFICMSLASVAFEVDSRMSRLENSAFH
jgi:hypothetical protein